MDAATTTTAPQLAKIAGIWRRLFAFCLDSLILGAVGYCLGLIAFDSLVALGNWGRALGFAIALAYFGAMDSQLFGGQSLGKRILGIKVVRADGAPLSVAASTLRAAIFCVPYFLNNANIDAGAVTLWLVEFLILGVGVSITYLLLFNRQTGQSLHDLAVGSYVVSARESAPIDTTRRIRPAHFGAVGLILVAAIALASFGQRLVSSLPIADLLSVQQELLRDPDVRSASAYISVSKMFNSTRGAETTHLFSSSISLSRRVTDLDPLANRLAHTILNRYPTAATYNQIVISVGYGYDIGIASASQRHKFAFSPEQWRKRFTTDTPHATTHQS